jgi:Ca2+-binding EF-hand superfamily protein
MAFDVLDQDGSGVVELSDIASAYNVSKHPDVLSGKKTKDQVLLEFLDNFDVGGVKDGKVTREEFQNYYSTVSSSIDGDDYFELMIRNAWHLSGGDGFAANTANKRVLVTKSDGSQEVVEIKKDLGLNIKDTQEVLRRLRAQGVDAVNVASFDSSDIQEPAKKGRPQTAASKLNSSRGKAADKETDKNNPMNIPPAGIKLLIEKVKKAMKIRGVNSFNDLQRRFKIMDDDHSLSLSYSEFKKALKELSSLSDLTEGDLRCLFSYFDKDSSGSIDFNEFLSGIRDPMNERRLALVKKAFDRLDADKSGIIELNDVINVYDTSKHPEVMAKRKTKNQVLTEFLANFEVDGQVDGKITYEEFVNYYHNISASIDNDNYFELMICNAWHINPNDTDKGANRVNTVNLRVMVTNSEGREEVIMLENDLGINESNKNDIKLLYARLRSQGVNDIYAINGKIIKVVNINGVDIITTIGETSTLKDDVQVKKSSTANQPVLKAPPFRRPQSANAIAMHGNNYQPVAGMVEPTKPTIAYGNSKPVVINAVDTNPVKSNSNRIDKNTQVMANNILNNLNKRKVINEKIKEENIVGNTLLDVLKVQLLSKGVQGIVDLQRKFSEIDRNKNSFIDLEEFTVAIQELNLIFSKEQIENLFNFLGK